MTETNKILNAILTVREKVGTVEKTGHNDFHNYDYSKANDIIRATREAVNEAQIVIIPTRVEDVVLTKDDTVEEFTMHYRLICAEDGSFIDASVRCAGEDKGDKRAYKANTGALKYLFIQVFLLETDDDPENDNEEKKTKTTKKTTTVKTEAAKPKWRSGKATSSTNESKADGVIPESNTSGGTSKDKFKSPFDPTKYIKESKDLKELYQRYKQYRSNIATQKAYQERMAELTGNPVP